MGFIFRSALHLFDLGVISILGRLCINLPDYNVKGLVDGQNNGSVLIRAFLSLCNEELNEFKFQTVIWGYSNKARLWEPTLNLFVEKADQGEVYGKYTSANLSPRTLGRKKKLFSWKR
jgi:hypothetical protein